MTAVPYFVHESSFVDEGCEIGEGTKIWHFCHVMTGARIGERCSIGQNVVVSPGVVIGGNVKIQNNVSVYTGVTLEDDVFCGPSMVFTNVINPRSHVSRKDEYRPTLVRRGATLGANSTIVCGHTIGQYAFIGAGAVVIRDVPDYALVVGNPGRISGWMCRCGVKLDGRRRCRPSMRPAPHAAPSYRRSQPGHPEAAGSRSERMSLAGQRILVIGGAGFIGGFVVRELLKQDVAEVVIFDNFTRGTDDNIAGSVRDPRCTVFPLGGDIRDVDILDARGPQRRLRVSPRGDVAAALQGLSARRIPRQHRGHVQRARSVRSPSASRSWCIHRRRRSTAMRSKCR